LQGPVSLNGAIEHASKELTTIALSIPMFAF